MANTFETIKIIDGKAQNIEYHQARFNQTILGLYKINSNIVLSELIEPKEQNIQRCKIVYNKDIVSIEYSDYTPKILKNFKIIESHIDYRYKYCDRDEFEYISQQNREFDDIIISRNGLLTDTTIANIAFLENNQWITPKQPLLNGTTRARLLESGFLVAKDIEASDISSFSGFAVMNALRGFCELNGYNITLETKGDR